MAKNSLPSVDDVKTTKQQNESLPQICESYTVPDFKYKDDDPTNHASQLRYWLKPEANLDRETAADFRAIWRRLEETGATTRDGRHVKDKAQTVRWIIQNAHKLLP
jgi:hypothetical protein